MSEKAEATPAPSCDDAERDRSVNRQIRLYYGYQAFSNLSMVSLVMSLYLQDIGFSLLQVGVLLGILQAAKTLLEIPTGFVADRWGSRASLLAALIIQIASYALMLIFHSFPAMVALMLALAVAYTLTTGCAQAIVVNQLVAADMEDKLTHMNSVSRVVYYCCYGVAAAISGFLADASWFLVFAVSIAALALALGCVLLMRADRPQGGTKDKENVVTPREIAHYIVHNRMVLYYCLVEGAVAWSMVPIDDFYTNYLSNYFDMPLAAVGIVTAVQFVLTSLVGLLSSRVAGRVREDRVVRLGPVAMLLLFTLCDAPAPALVLYMAGLAVFCLADPVRSKALQISVDSRYRVTVGSFSSIAISLLSSLSQPLYGWLTGIFDMHWAMTVLVIASIVLMGVINLAIPKRALGYGE